MKYKTYIYIYIYIYWKFHDNYNYGKFIVIEQLRNIRHELRY